MAQRLNKNLVVILTIAGMALMMACGIALIMLIPAADPAQFVKQGEEFEAKENWEQALFAYTNAAERARRRKSGNNETPRYLIRAGDMAYKAGKVGDALRIWERAVRDSETIADEKPSTKEQAQERVVAFYLEIHRLLGLGGKEWATVEEEARELKEINKDNVKALAGLGVALIKQRGIKPDNASQGEALLKQAIELKKGDPDATSFFAEYCLEEARILLSNPRPQETYKQADARIQEAQAAYEQLKAHLPEDPKLAATAWRYRGMFYLELRNLQWIRLEMARRGNAIGTEADLIKAVAEADRNCLESLEQAFKLDPTDEKSLCHTGDYWAFKPSTEKDEKKRELETTAYQARAAEAYEKATVLTAAARDEFDAYLKLANLHRRSGKLADAAQKLRERIDHGIKRGTHLEFRNRLYMLRLREELFDVGMAQATEMQRNSDALKAHIAELHKQHEAYANEAENGKENPTAKFMEGRMLLLEERYAEALEAVKGANDKLGGTDLKVKLNLAYLFDLNKAPAEAASLLNDVVQSGMPNHEAAWTMLAAVQLSLGRYDDAQFSADRALQLNSKSRDALATLARVYVAKNNESAALEISRRLSPQDENTRLVQEASTLLRPARAGEAVSPQAIANAKEKLLATLKTDPAYYPALQLLAARILAPLKNDTEAVKAEKTRELNVLLDTAAEAIDRKSAATQPTTGPARTDYRRIANGIKRLRVFAVPQDDRQKVLDELVKIISEEGDPYEVAVSLSQVYLNAGQPDKAIEQLQAALKIKPQEAALREELFALALGRKETWPLAEECITRLMEQNKADANGRFHRGRLALAKAEVIGQENNSKDAKVHATAARDELEAGLKEFPTNPDGYAYLGQANLILGQQDQARQALAKALELNPRHPTAVLLMYESARVRGDAAEQQLYLTRLKEMRSTHPLALQGIAAMEDTTNPEAAIKRREADAQRKPDDADNLFALAQLYASTGQIDKARDMFEKVRKLQPDNLMVMGRYAMLLRAKEPPEPAVAEQMLRQAVQELKTPGEKARAQLMLAGHLEEMARRGGQQAPAIAQVAEAYETAVKIDELPEILLDTGQFYVRNNQLKEAEAKFRRAVEVSNTEERRESNRRARRALVQLLMGIPDDRFADIEREIAAYGQKFDDGFAQIAHSDLALATGRAAEALQDMNIYISKLPQDATGYFRRGFIQYQRGAIQAAIKDLQEAASLDPMGLDFQHRRLLARCMADNGKTDLAIAQLKSILDDNKDVAPAARQLAELYMTLKQWGQAEVVLLPRARDPKDPNRIAWLVLLSSFYEQQSDVPKAIAAGHDILEAGNYQIPSIVAFADLCVRVNRPQEVIQLITTKLPAERRTLPFVQAKLAEAHAATKESTKALEIYNQLLDTAGEDLSMIRSIALNMAGALKTDAAPALKKRAAARPNDRGAKFALAVVQIYSDAYEDGVQAMKAFLEGITGSDEKAKADKINVLGDLCRGLHSHKNMPEARKYYEQLLQLDPGSVMAHNNLAYLLLNEFKEAQKALEHAELAYRSVSLSPGGATAEKAVIVDTLGWNLVLVGNYDAGIARLRQAIGLAQDAPASAEFKYTVAGIYYHAAEGYFRRSQMQGNTNAASDLEEAVLACRQAWRLLKTARTDDPDNVRRDVPLLAEKLKVSVEEEPPATQAAKAQ